MPSCFRAPCFSPRPRSQPLQHLLAGLPNVSRAQRQHQVPVGGGLEQGLHAGIDCAHILHAPVAELAPFGDVYHNPSLLSGATLNTLTTGFTNLSDGAKVFIGKDDAAPPADLAPRKRSRSPDAKNGGPAKDGAPKDGEHRGKRGEGDQKGQTGPAAGAPATGPPKQ